MASRQCTCGAGKLGYETHGDPAEVLKFCAEEELYLEPGEVLIRVIASPINHIDLEQIRGDYPIENKSFPQVAGNDGVGKVIKTGDGVTKFKKGDFVIPLVHGQGWWRLKLKAKQEEIYKVPHDFNIIAACMMTSIFCTAYRLLKDFGDIKSGDTIIQNGANSSVGQILTQLCKKNDLKNINIVRNRPDFEDLEEYITDLGGDYVMTDRDMVETCIFLCDRIAKPKIGFNGVGHVIGMDMMTHVMDEKSLLVTYGQASGKPLRANIKSLAYKDIKVCGFWMDKWHRDHLGKPEQTEMLEEIINMVQKGTLKVPHYAVVKFEDYGDALTRLLHPEGRAGTKFILDIGNVEEYEPEEETPPADANECNKKNCDEEFKKQASFKK